MKPHESSLRTRWRQALRRLTGRSPAALSTPLMDEASYSLLLDARGHILACSAALQRRLGLDLPPDATFTLAELLNASPPWLTLERQHWPASIPALEFKSSDSERIVMGGSLLQQEQHSLLLLNDISSTAQRLEQQEQVRRLWLGTARHAAGLRTPGRDALTVAGDWIEALALRLNIPSVLLLQKEAAGWRCALRYRRPGAAESTLQPEDLPFLRMQDCQQPRQEPNLLGEAVWAVPFSDGGQPQSWLCCIGLNARTTLPWISPEEWLQLFAMIAGPLRQQQLQRSWQQRAQQFQAVEALSIGGWWEYLHDSQSLRLSPTFARLLQLPAAADTRSSPAGSPEHTQDGISLTLDNWLQQVEAAKRDEFRVRLDAAATSNGRFVFSARLLVAGEPSWFRLEAEAVPGKNGNLLGFAFNTDEVQRREEEAEVSKARLAGLIDSVPGMIYVQHVEEGELRLGYCSASSQRLLGWSQQDLQNAPFASFLHPDDQELYFSARRDLLREGRADCQYRMRNRQGGYCWMQDEARVLRNDAGIPVEVVGVCLDITRTKEAIEQVFRSEENYRVLVEDSPAIICRYTPDLEVIFANPALATALALPQATTEGLNLRDYLSEEDAEAALQRLQQMTPERPMVSSELRIQRADLEYRWFVLYERGLFSEDGELIEVQAVGRDNTEVHQTRQQLFQSAKLATLGEMAAGLAHEINQPLSVIQMTLTNLLGRISKDTLTRDYLTEKLDRVSQQVQRSIGIVNHVRVFGRWMGPEGVLFSPASSVESALSLLSQRMRLQGIDVQLSGLENLPQILGHPDRLEQVLINLMTNASYALRDRKEREPELLPWLRIAASTSAGLLQLQVEDNGGGIPEALLGRIFEPFFTTKPVDHGTGLGLSVSREIITQMQGRLQVENHSEGARFTIELPVPEPAGSEISSAAAGSSTH